MHYKNIFSILSISICLNVGCLFGNYAFKKKVKSVCKSYRISVESSQLSLNRDEYSINMESGRNNFEMFMLVGFASAGQAIAHQKEMIYATILTQENERKRIAQDLHDDISAKLNVINLNANLLKGGDLKEELQDFPKAKVFKLSEFFEEEFFDTKKIVHLPI